MGEFHTHHGRPSDHIHFHQKAAENWREAANKSLAENRPRIMSPLQFDSFIQTMERYVEDLALLKIEISCLQEELKDKQ